MVSNETKEKLEYFYSKYNQRSFIENDPISIPHRFTKVQDIEISGLFAATLAWGNRKSIINSSNKLLNLMDNAPYDFICHHQLKDLIPFQSFVHRTFNTTDVLYFISFLKNYYTQHQSLETIFVADCIHAGLIAFKREFISGEHFPLRTKKHVSSPETNSTCKRLNMYLRWMVRSDNNGVDFGIWKTIQPSQLYMPLDVHVENYARKLGLITRRQRDWKTVEELTATLRNIDKDDPVRFDYALFGMGIEKVVLKPSDFKK